MLDALHQADPRQCDEVEALLPLVADGSLDERQDPALFAHLATCQRCQDSLVQHDLTALAVSGALTHAPTSPQKLRATIPFPRWRTAAAALVLIAVGGWLTWRPAVPVTPVVAEVPVLTQPAQPTPAEFFTTQDEPVIEITAMRGEQPGTRVHLIRRGDQVLVRETIIGAPRASGHRPEAVLPAGYSRY